MLSCLSETCIVKFRCVLCKCELCVHCIFVGVKMFRRLKTIVFANCGSACWFGRCMMCFIPREVNEWERKQKLSSRNLLRKFNWPPSKHIARPSITYAMLTYLLLLCSSFAVVQCNRQLHWWWYVWSSNAAWIFNSQTLQHSTGRSVAEREKFASKLPGVRAVVAYQRKSRI